MRWKIFPSLQNVLLDSAGLYMADKESGKQRIFGRSFDQRFMYFFFLSKHLYQ